MLDNVQEHLEVAWEWLQNTYDWQGLTIVGLMLSLVCVAWYYGSQRHLERAMARRTHEARWKKAKLLAQEKITETLEEQHKRGDLTRTEVDKVYQLLNNAGFKQIGFTPTQGRTWWRNFPSFNAPALKDRIRKRLHKSGVDIQAKLQNLRRNKAPSKREKLLASIKRLP